VPERTLQRTRSSPRRGRSVSIEPPDGLLEQPHRTSALSIDRAPELALSSWNVDGDVSALHTRYDVRLSRLDGTWILTSVPAKYAVHRFVISPGSSY